VRVRTVNALPEMEVDVEISGGDAAAVVQQLQEEFERAFRLRVPVLVVACGTLPRSEGKTRHFVSE
jgi:phenylacetate-coenzyme A ligase PaaK-like adenylate-forming protein